MKNKETNPRVLKMYSTGRFNHLTPIKSRTGLRGAKKPKAKDKK